MAAVLLIIIFAIVSQFYSYIFARHVEGEVVNVERITQPSAIYTSAVPAPTNSLFFSFAVAIRDSKGEIVTSSSEDRQWAVVQKGQCAEARYFPYPPWNLDKAGTYHDARLLKLSDCPKP